MTPEEFSRIRQIYEQVLTMAGIAREAFLERECRANSLIRAEVERLLGAQSCKGEPAELRGNLHALAKSNWVVSSPNDNRPGGSPDSRCSFHHLYTRAIETAELFGPRLYAEAFERG